MKMKVKGLIKGPFFWMLPLFLVLLIMFIYPTFEVIRYSFTDMSLLKEDYQYTFRSYLSVFRDKAFLNILKVTFIFVFFSVVFQTLLGFVIALAVDKGEALGMRGTVAVRVVSLLSWCIPGVIIGVIWKILLDETDTGILTSLLIRLGIGRVPFLTSAGSALVCAIIANIWRGTAQSMILSYSGLKTISKDILEAASIDGASAWQRLIHVIIPSVASVISINVVLNTISTFNTFDMIMSLTAGGPGQATEVLAMSAYNNIFKTYNLGKGSAYATILLVINGLMAVGYFIYLKKRGENE